MSNAAVSYHCQRDYCFCIFFSHLNGVGTLESYLIVELGNQNVHLEVQPCHSQHLSDLDYCSKCIHAYFSVCSLPITKCCFQLYVLSPRNFTSDQINNLPLFIPILTLDNAARTSEATQIQKSTHNKTRSSTTFKGENKECRLPTSKEFERKHIV